MPSSRTMFYKASLLAFATIASSSLSNAAVIVPGATWTDTSGNVIQAHGGGILKVGSAWYWHGEDKTHNSGLFRAVSCYSVRFSPVFWQKLDFTSLKSPDLMTWTRQNDALTPISGTSISTSNIVERPKGTFVKYGRGNTSEFPAVIYNRNVSRHHALCATVHPESGFIERRIRDVVPL